MKINPFKRTIDNMSPEKEYIRSKLVNELHEKYDLKCKELFYFKFTPKDSLNRFLLEQLSLGIDKKSNKLFDSNLSNPENVLAMNIVDKEIKSSLALTSNLKFIKNSRIKLIRTIKECIYFAKQSLGIKNYYKILEEENLEKILSQNNSLSDEELLESFEMNRKEYLLKLDGIIRQKLIEIKVFLYNQLKTISIEMNKLKEKNFKSDQVFIIELNNKKMIQVKYKEACFKLTEFHFEKLKSLFCLRENFSQCLFCILCRYQTYFRNNTQINEGYGMQAALPPRVFEYLYKEFEVTHEGFASPFNCYFTNYCSAFGDLDFAFKSNGSFFDFEPETGSFECNPPFTEEVIQRMAQRIEYLLEKSKAPLSFVVFIPEWLDPPTPGLVRMENSRFLRGQFNVERGNHKYVSGAQYVNESEQNFYDAVHNTRVFFLQNETGFIKWKPCEEKIKNLRESMQSFKN